MMLANGTHTACITGASSGIGAAFARELASRGYDLVLVARRATKLAQLAADLQAAFRVNAEALVADLSQRADVERVAARIAELPTLDLLVNNAGFGDPGLFSETPSARLLALMDVQMIASTALSHATLPGLIDRGMGGIINVSSVGGLLPSPGIEVVYCAAQAYLIAFSEGLQAQLDLQGAGVRVQALCPGFTMTEFHDDPRYAAQHIRDRIPKWLWMPAEAVVVESIRSLAHGPVVCIPGFKNRVIVALASSNLVPMALKLIRSGLRQRKNTRLLGQSQKGA